MKILEKYNEVMTIKEVAEALHCSYSLIYTLVQEGELPSFKVAKKYRITKEAVIAYLKKEKEENSHD